MFVISNKSFIFQSLRAVGPLGGKFSVPRDLKFKTILITEPQKSSSTLSEFWNAIWMKKSDTWSSNSNDLKI